MHETVEVLVNGQAIRLPSGSSVAVALVIAGAPCRLSASGEPRGPLCGMGVCFECRATVNGVPHSRTCQLVCVPGMDVQTNA